MSAAEVIAFVDDDATTIAGAIQYVDCGFCGSEAGERCRNRPWFGIHFYTEVPPGRLMAPMFAHYMRRAEYQKWRDVYGPPKVPEAKKSTVNVDDLLGP